MKECLVRAGLFLLLLLQSCAFVPSLGITDNADDAQDDVALSRRGWSMMRLGRGLQMLRLGKRSQRLDASQDLALPQAARDKQAPDLAAALAALYDDGTRGEFRRQPPLPRYGRELDVDLEAPDEFFSAHPAPLTVYSAYPGKSLASSPVSRLSTSDLVRVLAVLRGDRLKRSVHPEDGEMAERKKRAVALPRIGRYLDQLGRLYQWPLASASRLARWRTAKAVPAPRIGRQEDEEEMTAEGAAIAQSQALDDPRTADGAAPAGGASVRAS